MPADDRDAKFERALAHHLRGDAPAACPDAETLAAYHERSLSLEEMAHWKQHISGCAACQETLALVETTEKQLAEDWEEKKIPVLAAGEQQPVAARSMAAKREEASAVAPAPVEISQRRRPPLLRWAVPLGALAAGVLVWIGIHEQSALKRQTEGVQMTRNQPSSAPVQSAQNEVAPAPEQKLVDALRNAQPPAERDDRQAQLAEEGTRKPEQSPNLESRRVSPPVVLAKPKPSAKDGELAKKESFDYRAADGLAGKAAPAPPPPPPARAQAPSSVPASTTESVEVSAASPPSATGSFQAGAGVGGAAGGNAGDAKSAPAQEADSIAAARAGKEKARNKQQTANDLDTSAMMMKQGVNGRNVTSLKALVPAPVILTPDNKVWWKLDPAGTLELTTDGGKTWKPVDAGAAGQLTAGSAPSSKICWIAGKAGTLVFTADRGAHWKALSTPIVGDIGGVRATDAKHASIWDAARQQAFETSDGGATWTRTAP